MLFPAFPSYSKVPHDLAGSDYIIKDDVCVQLMGRVGCAVRVLDARVTPAGCSGADFAGMDVFCAYGWAVTPAYHAMKAGRLSGAFISDDSIVSKDKDAHERCAYLPSTLQLGEAAYKHTTHLHVVTGHKQNWQQYMPTPGEIYKLDLFFVRIVSGAQVLASGAYEFGTLKCPWVIPAAHVPKLEKFNA